ncbi:FxSxx-COOH cyclophane-containing RiPP peptide [Streptomyces sp. 6N223]|uniref:FxSxx-COOH cyclophane-containing RiPP peptide n=1 Tax=Streptomyces sp. 6N223 TaxID=3457412 RepID=UPI003FD2663C
MTPCPRDAARDAPPTGEGFAAPREPLPDLLGLSLAELRRLDHPVLNEILDELRDRMVRPGETLWNFQQAW